MHRILLYFLSKKGEVANKNSAFLDLQKLTKKKLSINYNYYDSSWNRDQKQISIQNETIANFFGVGDLTLLDQACKHCGNWLIWSPHLEK